MHDGGGVVYKREKRGITDAQMTLHKQTSGR